MVEAGLLLLPVVVVITGAVAAVVAAPKPLVAAKAAANARLAHSRAVVGTRGSRNWRVAKLALLAAMASRGSRVRSRALSMAVVTGTASRIRPSFASRVAASNGNRRA